MFPLTQFVIYHESKIGPFLKKNDSIFPKWIKNFKDPKFIANFKNRVIRMATNEKI